MCVVSCCSSFQGNIQDQRLQRATEEITAHENDATRLCYIKNLSIVSTHVLKYIKKSIYHEMQTFVSTLHDATIMRTLEMSRAHIFMTRTDPCPTQQIRNPTRNPS